jgi:hypothetical protein
LADFQTCAWVIRSEFFPSTSNGSQCLKSQIKPPLVHLMLGILSIFKTLQVTLLLTERWTTAAANSARIWHG